MFPVDALGTHYIVNAPAVTTIPTGKVEIVRIIATAAEHDADVRSAAGRRADDDRAAPATSSRSRATRRASRSRRIRRCWSRSTWRARSAGGGTGDPAMALAVPVEQFRTSYLFHAPTNYETNYVDVTAPMGATVTLDGAPLDVRADRHDRLRARARQPARRRPGQRRQPRDPGRWRSASPSTATASTRATGTGRPRPQHDHRITRAGGQSQPSSGAEPGVVASSAFERSVRTGGIVATVVDADGSVPSSIRRAPSIRRCVVETVTRSAPSTRQR